MRTGGRISPHSTPAFFLENLVPLCDDIIDGKILADRANALVGEFMEGMTILYVVMCVLNIDSHDCSSYRRCALPLVRSFHRGGVRDYRISVGFASVWNTVHQPSS